MSAQVLGDVSCSLSQRHFHLRDFLRHPNGEAMNRVSAFVIGALTLAGAIAADDPSADPEVQKTLKAMHNASTWFHPDLFGLTQGMQEYSRQHYAAALKLYEVGALYADKLSQLCIWLMHLNGESGEKDPVAAYAWIDLAAERGYPQFVATRDDVAKSLTADQLHQAKRLRAKLGERYGDAVAKPRMALQLKLGMMNFTGSRTGFDSGVTQISEVPCGPALVIGGRAAPQIGCGGMNDFLAKDNWKPDVYFAARDREWMPQVTVGPMTDAGAATSGAEKNSGDVNQARH
jgi:hypothetical protein